jgi:predicted Zn finger-like uncharacterized protein
MIVKCNACRSQYEIDDDILKPAGRKLKCSQCADVFFQPPPITKTVYLTNGSTIDERNQKMGQAILTAREIDELMGQDPDNPSIDLAGIFNSSVVNFNPARIDPINEEETSLQILTTQTVGATNEATVLTILDPKTKNRYMVALNRMGGIAIQPL